MSQSLQEYVKKSNVLNALSTDHSPVFCSTKGKAKVFGSLITL